MIFSSLVQQDNNFLLLWNYRISQIFTEIKGSKIKNSYQDMHLGLSS